MPTFTQATPADLPTLASMLRDFYTEEHLPFAEKNLTALQTLLANSALGHAYLIRDDANAFAGYFILTFSFSLERGGKTALLDELYILPHARQKTLGTAALQFALAQARRAHCQTLLLEVDHANPRAQSFYRRNGFQTIPRQLMARPASDLPPPQV